MATVRLNKTKREAFIAAVVADTFKQQTEKVAGMHDELCGAVYDYMYPAELQKKMKDFQEETEGCAFGETNYIRVYFEGRFLLVGFTEPRLVLRNHPKDKYIKPGNPLFKLWEKYSVASEDLRVAERDLEVKVRAIVDSVTTVKKLLEVWPESATWIDSIADSGDFAPVPAVTVSEVNCIVSKNKGE